MRRIVLDTNVVVSGMRSREGASYRLLLELGGNPRFRIFVSVPLAMEYEMALKRTPGLRSTDAEGMVDFLCEVGEKREIYFLWRPFLRDPKDEMVLEVAVEAQADAIVTHNVRDFKGVEDRFGIRIVTPGAFLLELEGEAK
ncbi:MAG: putative toxin-antitoxin system toxin component, PIN family [Gemmatimonadota bacterium]|jgi:putative PIN family toxin of toxin-antitoxin system